MGYNGQHLWDTLGKNNRIYCKTMEYIGKNYGIYYGIYLSKTMGYNWLKVLDILGRNIGIIRAKSIGYIGQN